MDSQGVVEGDSGCCQLVLISKLTYINENIIVSVVNFFPICFVIVQFEVLFSNTGLLQFFFLYITSLYERNYKRNYSEITKLQAKLQNTSNL